MDSITHITLGACIGEAALSKQLGKKALILGAIAQSLPDIDVITSLWLPPTESLLAHRGFTHSLLFGVIAAVILSFITKKIFRSREISFTKLFFFFCLQIWLHDLLDTTNSYGTGLFEPFSHQRFSVHLLFVADPFFSISLIIAFVALIILKKDNRKRKSWVMVGLLPASIYFCCAIFNKMYVEKQVKQSLSHLNMAYKDVIITPTPFNTWLWYIVVATDSGYDIGYRSVFDRKGFPLAYFYHSRNEHLLQATDTTANVKRLLQFADGYYTVELVDSELVFNVLRFGQTGGWHNAYAPFTFQYFLSPAYNNVFVVQRGRFKGWNRKTISGMWDRIRGR